MVATRTRRISFKVSQAEWDAIAEEAKRLGMPISAFCRYRLLPNDLKKEVRLQRIKKKLAIAKEKLESSLD